MMTARNPFQGTRFGTMQPGTGSVTSTDRGPVASATGSSGMEFNRNLATGRNYGTLSSGQQFMTPAASSPTLYSRAQSMQGNYPRLTDALASRRTGLARLLEM